MSEHPEDTLNHPTASLDIPTTDDRERSPTLHCGAASSRKKDKESKADYSPVDDEKRLSRYRSTPNQQTRDRIERAKHQRMFMIEKQVLSPLHQTFAVLGSTGNIYTVSIEHVPTCTCPDFLRGNLCKHILFVYLKCLRVNASSPLVFQKALLTSELRVIFESASRVDPRVVANHQVIAHYKAAMNGESLEQEEVRVEQKSLEGTDCPICFEDLADGRPVVWCKAQCGNNIHNECFDQWKKSKLQSGGQLTCVYCRSPWGDGSSSKDRSHDERCSRNPPDSTESKQECEERVDEGAHLDQLLVTSKSSDAAVKQDTPDPVVPEVHAEHCASSSIHSTGDETPYVERITAATVETEEEPCSPDPQSVNDENWDANTYSADLIRIHCQRRDQPSRDCDTSLVIEDSFAIAAKIAAKRVAEWKAQTKMGKARADAKDQQKRQLKHKWRCSIFEGEPKDRLERLAETKLRIREQKRNECEAEAQERKMRWYKRKAALGLNTQYLCQRDTAARACAILQSKLKERKLKESSAKTRKNQIARALKHVATVAKQAREASCHYVCSQGSFILKHPDAHKGSKMQPVVRMVEEHPLARQSRVNEEKNHDIEVKDDQKPANGPHVDQLHVPGNNTLRPMKDNNGNEVENDVQGRQPMLDSNTHEPMREMEPDVADSEKRACPTMAQGCIVLEGSESSCGKDSAAREATVVDSLLLVSPEDVQGGTHIRQCN
ncbi:hypothetical protein Ae201684P_002896 [Aphanomyces euteiches]|nr:hypothetical protein Ae201684P_002896 [Aphanomyces euteiches]